IGIWNVMSMNQDKLEVVKQEMARVNVDILGISELKWTGMGEFNSDDHVQNAVLGCNLKNNRMISVRFQGKPFNITMGDITFRDITIQVYAPTSNAEEAEVERFYEDLQDLLELTPKKDVLFIIGDWNAKVGSQETPGVTGKFGLGIDSILCSQRWRSSIKSAKTRLGADCGSDHEILISKCRLKLKKVGKTTNHSGKKQNDRDLFKKIRDTKGTFHAKMGSIKDR
ncbi:hypothetical protein M91_15880, partial [Bos mutus]